MTFRALELRTEVMLMDGVSTFEDRGDHVIQRTPGEPDFWEGNRLILKLADLRKCRRLGQVQLFGRASVTKLARNRLKNLHLSERVTHKTKQ